MPAAAALLVLALAASGGQGAVLEIRSQAGVEVLWQGVSLGTTNARGRLEVGWIPAGDYTITL